MNNLFSLFSVIVFLNTGLLNTQVVNIPDTDFKNYLIGEPTINTNGDNEIQITEAQAFTGTIQPSFLVYITDLTGIEVFTGITGLDISFNGLTTLDLSTNVALTNLNVGFNQLTALDVSNNTALVELRTFSNQMTVLDVSNNTALTYLNVSSNQIAGLDVSNCSLLTHLECIDNALVDLNVKNGNNTNFTAFDIRNNSNLNCIDVDDVAYSTTNWTNIDSVASFSLSCGLATAMDELENSFVELQCFPNPTNKNFRIDLGKSHATINVTIRNLVGQTIGTQNYREQQFLDLSLNGNKGAYFVTLQSPKSIKTIKVIKE